MCRCHAVPVCTGNWMDACHDPADALLPLRCIFCPPWLYLPKELCVIDIVAIAG
jgi:hypothetical protein